MLMTKQSQKLKAIMKRFVAWLVESSKHWLDNKGRSLTEHGLNLISKGYANMINGERICKEYLEKLWRQWCTDVDKCDLIDCPFTEIGAVNVTVGGYNYKLRLLPLKGMTVEIPMDHRYSHNRHICSYESCMDEHDFYYISDGSIRDTCELGKYPGIDIIGEQYIENIMFPKSKNALQIDDDDDLDFGMIDLT